MADSLITVTLPGGQTVQMSQDEYAKYTATPGLDVNQPVAKNGISIRQTPMPNDDLSVSSDLHQPLFPGAQQPPPVMPSGVPLTPQYNGRDTHQTPGPNDNLAMFQPGGSAAGFMLPDVGTRKIPGVAGLPMRNPLDLIEQYESNGRNILQTAYSGEGVNPSTGTHTAPSSASGYYQITDSTWKEWAPKAGIDVSQFPTAMSAPKEVQRKVAQYGYDNYGYAPWASFNSRLASAVGFRGTGGRGSSELGLAGPAPVDYTQLGKNALAQLDGADLKSALAQDSTKDDLGPWQRLQLLSMVQNLMGQGTHKFEPVGYDPFAAVKPQAVATPALLPAVLGSEPYVTRTGMRSRYAS